MTGGQKAALGAAVLFVVAIGAGVVITLPTRPIPTVSVLGTVLRQDSDPRRQMPIENADITATVGMAIAQAKSDASGFFQLTLHPAEQLPLPITLTFRHPGYQPLEMTQPATQICVARMLPTATAKLVQASASAVLISNVRLRYSTKATTTVSVGSVAPTFEIVHHGSAPCNGHPPCSPDGKWKAEMGSTSLDAGQGNEFLDVRASCIAGPCPFTKIESDLTSNAGRNLKVVALDWSDTATFLVEAQVTHIVLSDLIRQSYPVIFGNGMNFTLPPAAEGPSIEADLGGSDIVFPLGPDIILSWAACTVKIDADRSKLYRCELKPGYRFQ